jgi:hypothetical protein
VRSRPAREPRLDPARWRRPGRGVLIRLAAITLLLATAAALLWSRPAPTLPPSPTAPKVRSSEQHSTPSAAMSAPASGTAVPAGAVGVPVRLAEPAALRLLHPGDRVDLFRVGEDSAPVATAALVLQIAGVDDPTSGGLLLALTPAEAQCTVTAAGKGYAVVIRPDG